MFRSLLWFVPLYVLFFYVSEPVFDWLVAHPVPGVAAIGLMSFAMFGFDAVRNWRDGSDIALSLRQRMTRNPLAETQGLRGLYIILGGLVFVWMAVLAFGLAEVSEEKRPLFILVAGGSTAFFGAPFALYPAALVFGALSPAAGFEARVALTLASPVPGALARRADLTGMPASSGFGPVRSVAGGRWRSDAVSPIARWFTGNCDYRVEPLSHGLTIEALTERGDRETLTLTPESETRIAGTISVEARSVWNRTVLRIAGPQSYANTVAASEAARLTWMIGVAVTFEPPEVS